MRKSITLLICLASIYTMRAQVTIEHMLSVPFPTELKSSADGKHLAWIFNDRGIRNVFIADAPDFAPRKLTDHHTDDGIDITDLRFTDDGSKLTFTEGNPQNTRGEAANPAQLQSATEQTVWTVHTDGSGLRSIGKGANAAPSPDGKTVAFVSAGKIYTASLDTTGLPKQLFAARGNMNSIRWSPDGSILAFVSNRTDHAFIGLYRFADKSVSFPDASVDHDQDPVWSPDGQWLAYIRVPDHRSILPYHERRSGSPWSIRLLNVASAQAKQLWMAAEGKGSMLYDELPVMDNMLLWADDNQLIFPSEADGWLHLYALDIFKAGKPRLLTPGEGEVEDVVLSPDRKNIFYNTNIGDQNSRHIWKLYVADGKQEEITKGENIDWQPALLQNGMAVLRSTAKTPGWPTLILEDGTSKRIAPDLFPRDFPANELVKPQDVSFTSKDGMKIHGQLFLPPDYREGKKYPALVFIHGGSRRQMLLGFHYMDYYSNDYAMNQYNAHNGYIVLSVNYRSGIGYGMEFREALHYGANGGSEYNDILAAGLFLKAQPDVDKNRIGLWGGSYGGYLTAMGLARNSDVFSCGVDVHGVHDWSTELKARTADYDPETVIAFNKIAVASSPVYFVNGWRSPVLFIHGDDDRNVPFSQTVNLIEKLRKQNVHCEQLIFPDEVHTFLLHSTWLKAYHAASDFFERELKNKKTTNKTTP